MDLEEQIDAIGAIFRCDRDSANALNRAFSVQRVDARAIIANQGDPSSHCWIVIEGAIRIEAYGVDGQRQQLAQHGPGEFFGAFPGPTTHRAEISAGEPSLLLRCEAVRLAQAVASNAQIGAGMANLLARQLDRALDRMVTRTTYSAAGRVYAELLALADGKDFISPPPQVTALALSANTTRETASRAIAALTRRGVISRNEERLTIHAPRMLMELIS